MDAGWITALVLYVLGAGIFGWASTMRAAQAGAARRLSVGWMFLWPFIALIGTILFLIPGLDKTVKMRARELKRQIDKERGKS